MTALARCLPRVRGFVRSPLPDLFDMTPPLFRQAPYHAASAVVAKLAYRDRWIGTKIIFGRAEAWRRRVKPYQWMRKSAAKPLSLIPGFQAMRDTSNVYGRQSMRISINVIRVNLGND